MRINNIDTEKKGYKINKKDIKDLMMTVITAIALSMAILSVFRITVVQGESMDNTLHDGQHLILNRLSYSFGKTPEYKDIIVIERDDLSTKYLIKRVIGVSGDHIVIKDNQLYINDELINEDYIKEPMVTEDMDIIVPDGKVFVMGDNRNHSIDSRKIIIGYVDIDTEIVGKVLKSDK